MFETYKSLIHIGIKFFITSLVLYWLMNHVDYPSIIKTFHQFSYHTIIWSFISLWFCYALGAWRWRYILHKQENVPFTFKDSAVIVMIGVFLNQGLPGSLGGDVYRGFKVKEFGFSRSWSIQSILIDRAFGLFFMGVMGIGALFFFDIDFLKQETLLPLYLVLFSICVGFILFCQLDRFKMSFKYKRVIEPLQNIARLCRALSNPCNSSFFISCIAITFFLYLPVYLLSMDLEQSLSLAAVLFVLPTVFLISFLPISFAGWGVREVAFIALFNIFGISPEQALSLSIAYGLISLVSVFPGFILYVCRRQNINI